MHDRGKGLEKLLLLMHLPLISGPLTAHCSWFLVMAPCPMMFNVHQCATDDHQFVAWSPGILCERNSAAKSRGFAAQGAAKICRFVMICQGLSRSLSRFWPKLWSTYVNVMRSMDGQLWPAVF